MSVIAYATLCSQYLEEVTNVLFTKQCTANATFLFKYIF